MICDLFDFRWSELIKIDPMKRDRSRKCAYHKDHGHTTEQCRSLHYLVERLIRARHLKQYVHTIGGKMETTWDLVIQVPTTLATLRVIINYIHGGLVDEKYNSKQKRQRLLRVASIREHINSIQHSLPKGSANPMDDTITFPPIKANPVLQPHEDTLILTLGISGFDVRRVLIDPGSSTDLLQVSAYRK